MLVAATLAAPTVQPAQSQHFGALTLSPSFNSRLGLQYGTGINYGVGALDALGETERTALFLVLKPRLNLDYALTQAPLIGASNVYAGVSVVVGSTLLDGELSGQQARSGDTAVNTDHAYVGWRNELLDLSFGGQEFSVGDGFVIGDGNYNKGGENGQYWTGGFAAWRNSAILKVNTQPLRADLFWLRTDTDFKDGRVAGISVETTTLAQFGTLGVMYLDVLQGGAFNYDGIKAWNLRGTGIHLPDFVAFKLYGEWVLERGRDKQGGGRGNDASAWYVEGEYTLPRLPWLTRLSYRYAWMSGDDAKTPRNEEYRGLYFTIFKRDWDTWYQGEIAGEYHLFNENQITQMVKLKTFPRADWALTFYYYHHELQQPHYFAIATTARNWADEINFGVEHFLGERFYGYAGVAWSTPNAAARQVFGNHDFTVIQTYLSYTF